MTFVVDNHSFAGQLLQVKASPNIEPSWREALEDEFRSPYFGELKAFLVEERSKYTIYPPSKFIFNAYDRTPLPQVKVVILGQDPYHVPGQAHGLSFSVLPGQKFPPSLKNIFKELNNDLGISVPLTGDLTPWAEQGVMMLNATLTVRHKSPGSHQKRGWESFTDATIRTISEKRDHVVFMLWGNYARAKRSLIDSSRHLVLEAAHPSPFSAHQGYFGSNHFSKANAYLEEHHIDPVDWSLPS